MPQLEGTCSWQQVGRRRPGLLPPILHAQESPPAKSDPTPNDSRAEVEKPAVGLPSLDWCD